MREYSVITEQCKVDRNILNFHSHISLDNCILFLTHIFGADDINTIGNLAESEVLNAACYPNLLQSKDAATNHIEMIQA